jgi:hypothetical protein
VWAATDKLEGTVLHARSYYQGQQAEPPSAAELVAVVVAVSRLVQAEFGAVEGRGECSLRCDAAAVFARASGDCNGGASQVLWTLFGSSIFRMHAKYGVAVSCS